MSAFHQRALLLSRGSMCHHCWRAQANALAVARREGRRHFGKGYSEHEADSLWNERAKRIAEGSEQNLWDKLEQRGYVKDVAGSKDTIRELMRTRRIAAYVGIDPTAPSLHIGHLLPLMPLFWMYMHGYGAVSLIGGATAQIGDPSGRLQSRNPLSRDDARTNPLKIQIQLKKVWQNVELRAKQLGYEKDPAWSRGTLNNSAWWAKQPFVEILSRVGASMRIGAMLSRDTVKNKMTQGDGVSFAEFSYPLLQGWDWWTLFKKNNVQMQIGGSDQFGNIISGIDVFKAARASEPTDPMFRPPAQSELDDPVGFTVPLLTDRAGNKFGKSAGNAVWLDPLSTSIFDLYGYFVRRPDDQVENLLKLFTFLPLEDIQKTMEIQNQDPSKRVAQHLLAYEVVTLVHGEESAKRTQAEHMGTYGKTNGAVAGQESTGSNGRPEANKHPMKIDRLLPRSFVLDVRDSSLPRIIHAAGLSKSLKEAKRVKISGGAYIGRVNSRDLDSQRMLVSQLEFVSVKQWFAQDTEKYLVDSDLLVLRHGKHSVRVIKLVSDEEYAESGENFPGNHTDSVGKLVKQMRSLKQQKAKLEAESASREAVTAAATDSGGEPELDTEPVSVEALTKHMTKNMLDTQILELEKEISELEKKIAELSPADADADGKSSSQKAKQAIPNYQLGRRAKSRPGTARIDKKNST